MKPFRILLIEDDEQIRSLLLEQLSGQGYQINAVASGGAARALLETQIFDAALIDIHLPDMNGIEVLDLVKRHDPGIDAILMTGYPELATAVQALRLGAYDYLTKPLDSVSLHHLFKKLVERRYLQAEVKSLRTRLAETLPIGDLIGSSRRIQDVRETIAKIAPTDSVVLIEGESGTGKEIIAGAVHRLSNRSTGPFVPINCGAMPAELIESELFGHVKGAFSGASAESPGLFRSAEGGTLFLDEIGDLPLQMQPKLLRVLQEKEVRSVGSSNVHRVNVRLVAATNQKLESAVQSGKFRQDLFFRLNVVRIEPPPLREVKEDIPALVMHFVRQQNRRFGRHVTRVAPDAMAKLTAYSFPGNVRELENILERAYALGANYTLTLSDLASLPSAPGSVTPGGNLSHRSLEDFERELIAATLQIHENDKARTAKALGLSERTLYRRLKKLSLD